MKVLSKCGGGKDLNEKKNKFDLRESIERICKRFNKESFTVV